MYAGLTTCGQTKSHLRRARVAQVKGVAVARVAEQITRVTKQVAKNEHVNNFYLESGLDSGLDCPL